LDKVHAIILAAGKGERLGNKLPKQFLKISGKSVVEHTIDIFESHKKIDEITIVVHPLYKYLIEDILLKRSYKKVKRVLEGGSSRKESSFIGISALEDSDKVLIHDAVRPFVSERIITDCINALDKYKAVDVAIPSADTIIEINEKNFIKKIPERKNLLRGQTPQAFRVGLIKKAHIMSQEDGFNDVTDDCGLILKYNLADVFVVPGEESNIKITFKEDLYLADRLFQIQSFKLFGNVNLNQLNDKVIIVFGGSKGIGKEIVILAERHGAKVYFFSRSNGVDISKYDQVETAVENIFKNEGKIDFIVNTAGILNIGSIASRSIDEIISEININYLGAINIIKTSINYLTLSNGSILLFTSSSYTRGRALYSIYSSTKAAIVNLVQGIHEELIHQNIRINAINPERTDTPMRRNNFGKEPKNTLLDPSKVAEIALQTLLLDISGQIIDVRRGNTM